MIPESLIKVRSLQDLGQWMRNRHRESPKTMRAELGAYNALQTERFVRRNVSRPKFLS